MTKPPESLSQKPYRENWSDILIHRYPVALGLPNDPFNPNTLVYRQLQRFGFELDFTEVPHKPQFLIVTSDVQKHARKILQLLHLVYRDRAYINRSTLMTYVASGNYEGVQEYIDARDNTGKFAGMEPVARIGTLSNTTINQCFLRSFERFQEHPMYHKELQRIMSGTDSKQTFEQAVTRHNRLVTNGLNPIDPEEMAGLCLGPNFSTIWDTHPELHP